MRPVAVHHNVTFVIDLLLLPSLLIFVIDLGADDNGTWEISCPKQRFRISREDGRIKSICHTKDDGEGVITLRRQYAHHKATGRSWNPNYFTKVLTLTEMIS